MTLADLENEVLMIINHDPVVQPYIQGWLLGALDQIALDFFLPALKLIEPYELETDGESWLYTLPAHYHKSLFEARDGSFNKVHILPNMQSLLRLDYGHTQTGDRVERVAVQDRQIGTYPLAEDTLSLWFYMNPEGLQGEDGEEDDRLACLPPEFHRRLLIPKLVLMNLEAMMDAVIEPPMQSMGYWTAAYSRGLYGTPRGELGFVHWLARQESNQPRAWLGWQRL